MRAPNVATGISGKKWRLLIRGVKRLPRNLDTIALVYWYGRGGRSLSLAEQMADAIRQS